MELERSAYFAPESIAQVAAQMMTALRPLARDRIALDPERCALLILDMQGAFLDRDSHAFVPSADAILPGVLALQEAFSRRGLPTVCTVHVNSQEDAGMMDTWWRNRIEAGTPGSRLWRDLAASCTNVLEKSQYDAFHRTALESLLHERGVEQLVIAGVMTHLCCDTTARSAFVRGFRVFVCVDGTATYNEALHRGSLLGLTHGVAEMRLVHEVLRALEDDVEG